jgi:hypothetical protein
LCCTHQPQGANYEQEAQQAKNSQEKPAASSTSKQQPRNPLLGSTSKNPKNLYKKSNRRRNVLLTGSSKNRYGCKDQGDLGKVRLYIVTYLCKNWL